MTKFPASPSYEKEIKQDLKAMMQMTRAPRSLDIFYYFHFIYKKQQKLIEKRTDSIGGTLRRKRIELVAPSTKVIKEKLGFSVKDYDKYFDAFVIWENKYYSSYQGRGRTIKGWSPAAVSLFEKWKEVPCPEEIEKLFYIQTRTADIGGTLSRSFYHRTKNSYRWYHPDQNLSSDEKKQLFKGAFNVDIISCFPSIWWYDLGGYDCELENAYLLHPQHRLRLLEVIKKDFGIDDNATAKKVRTKLTASKRHANEKTGVIWFDALREHIIAKTLKWGEQNLPEDIKLTVHNVFTFLEAQIINRMLEAGEEILLMHDGIIFRSLNRRLLEAKAFPHAVKTDRW